MAGEDDPDDLRLGRNPDGDGSAHPSPASAARPPFPRIRRTCALRTIFRVDPKVGIGVYTESARVRLLLERAGLPVASEGAGAYCVIPADQSRVAARVLECIFP